MNFDPNAPHFVLAAVTRIYADLPALVGADWPQVQPQVDTYMMQLRAQPNQYLPMSQLLGLLAHYEPARQRMAAELDAQEQIGKEIIDSVAQMAREMKLDPAAAEGLLAAAFARMNWQMQPNDERELDDLKAQRYGVKLSDGGADGATITGLSNIQLDLGDLSSIAGGFISAGVGFAAAPIAPQLLPFAVLGTALATVSTIYKAMKVTISVQEATVFWGIIQGTQGVPGAGLYPDSILSYTNAERTQRGLAPLTAPQVNYSLERLYSLGCLARTGESYRIDQNYTVKD
ncbi:MAG: hypothetical protein JNJ61_01070 [Anaerolineae bacterium]|nr:hypothetical protein [Anaerolineae bacterium]